MTLQLADQQRRLADAVRLQHDPQGVLAVPVEPGLAVYRNAYSARLLAALNDNYTVLARAMGDEDFERLGRAYIDAHPSRHPSIRWFGHELAAFMAEADDSLVGHASFIDFARMDWALRRFEIGYWVRSSAQRRGLAREAVQAMARLAFTQLRARRVEIRMDELNQASQAVARSCGFALEGVLRQESLGVNGSARDTCVYALTALSGLRD